MRASLGIFPLLSVLTVTASVAVAKVSNPITSGCPGCWGSGSTPPYIRVVELGRAGSVPHGGSEITIIPRDIAAVPEPGAIVELDFSECPDIVLCDAVPAGIVQTVDCPNHTIRAVADATGRAVIVPLGSGLSNGAGGAPGPDSPPGCVRLRVDGVPLSSPSAVVYDLDGATRPEMNGTTVTDLAQLAFDLFSGTYHPRSDFSSMPNAALFPGDSDGCSGPALDCGALTVADIAGFVNGVLFAPAPNSALGCSPSPGVTSYCPH